MRWVGDAYRGHDPRWAWHPLSGDGAAARGGRFNPKGVPTLYLALTVEGVLCEMAHGFPRRFDPLTICTYRVDVSDLVDLRTEALRSASGIGSEDLACAWEYDLTTGRRPASWKVHDRLTSEGAAGILVPSFARGTRPDMYNLVLWKWGPDLWHKVEVHDPSGRLPRNQLSWA